MRDTRAADATLGDLAERLEEALAQEVQAANEDRRHELDLDAFGFDRTREAAPSAPAAAPTPVPMPAPEPKKAAEQRKPEPKKPIEPKERVALKERVEAARAAASPSDAEVKREPDASATRAARGSAGHQPQRAPPRGDRSAGRRDGPAAWRADRRYEYEGAVAPTF